MEYFYDVARIWQSLVVIAHLKYCNSPGFDSVIIQMCCKKNILCFTVHLRMFLTSLYTGSGWSLASSPSKPWCLLVASPTRSGWLLVTSPSKPWKLLAYSPTGTGWLYWLPHLLCRSGRLHDS